MDRAHSNYTNDYRSYSPDRSVYHRPQNQPCTDFSDPSSLLKALQNNPDLQDPQCLNKVLIPMLLVQLLQNQQTCQHCPDVNRQAPYPEQHRSRRQRSFHDCLQPSDRDCQPSRGQPFNCDADPPVQEVYSVPPGRYRSNEYILDQSPPSIQCSEEDIRHACCDSIPDYCDTTMRRNLLPSRSHHYAQQHIARTRSPSPERGIVERCYWCRQQLYRYYDPDLCKRVFTHFPCHRGAILAPAGKSSFGSIRQMSLVDTSPFNPRRDVMLPCPYLCAKTETTYNSSFRHPEVVARESVCGLVSKKSQPWEQCSNAPIDRSSLESIGHRDKPELPNRLREERVMFLKPICCPSRARSSQMTNSSVDVVGYDRRYRKPGPCTTLANTSLDFGYNSRKRRSEPSVSFSPSTDAYQRHRSMEKKKERENVSYYNCRPPQKNEDGGYDLYCKPDPHHPQPGSRSSMEREKLQYYNCRPPQKSKDGGYDLYCKPDLQHRRHGSGLSSKSSSVSSPCRSRRSRHSHGNASARSRHSRHSHGNASGRSRRRHSAPYKFRFRGPQGRRPRAKSDFAAVTDHQRSRRHRSQSSRRRHRSQSSRRRHRSQSSRRRHHSRSSRGRRRHSRPRYSMSDPAVANQGCCEQVEVCCPAPHTSIYNASYGNPAEHPYYEGPSNLNFRRQRFERN